MASLSITDLKKNTIFSYEGKPYKVVEYSQKVMGRGGSIVSVKIKNLIDGRVLSKTFKGNDSVQSAEIENRNAQFLYSEQNKFFFMDSDSYENYEIPYSFIEEQSDFIKEGQEVQLQSYNGNIVNLILPPNLYLKVEYAENAVKGDTSSALTKDARLETGKVIKVPAFIKTGDIVSVDTTTGKYRERKKT